MYCTIEARGTYEAGANSRQIREAIVEGVDEIAVAQTAGSALRRKLDAQHDYVDHQVLNEDNLNGKIGWPPWWSNVDPDCHVK